MYLNEFCIIFYQEKVHYQLLYCQSQGMKRWKASTIAFWRYLTCCVSGGGCTLSLWVFHHSPSLRTHLQCILVLFNGLRKQEALMSAFWRYFAFSVWWAGSLGKSILHCFSWSWASLNLLLYSLKGPMRREARMSAIWRYFIYSILGGRYSKSLNSRPCFMI